MIGASGSRSDANLEEKIQTRILYSKKRVERPLSFSFRTNVRDTGIFIGHLR